MKDFVYAKGFETLLNLFTLGVRRLCKTKLRLALNATAHTCNENPAIFVDACFDSSLSFTSLRGSARLARTSKVDSHYQNTQNKNPNNRCHLDFYGGAEATKLELLIIKFIENLRKPEIYDATRMIDFRKLSIKVA